MKPETFSCMFEGKVQFNITIKSRVTIIRGDSATGKTVFLECISNPRSSESRTDVTLYEYDPAENPVDYLRRRPSVRYVFIDEDSANKMDRLELLENILDAGYYLVIATRSPLRNLTYAITDVYYMHTENNITTLRSYYQDYSRFIAASSYACEDTKSGYQYWRSRLPVQPMSGNRNWINYVKDNCLIVDGAAFGNQIADVIKYTQNIYAPLSFECLLLYKYCGYTLEVLISELKDTDKTFERLCSRLVIEERRLGFKYTKTRLPNRVLLVDLIPELKTYINKWLQDLFKPEVLSETSKNGNTKAINNFLLNLGFPEEYGRVYSSLPDVLDKSLWKNQILDALQNNTS